ncbi:MAG: YbgA family protein [Tissierellia bacterium]|nr:YbgA family protein [Tissierellia bacterium]
MTFKSSIPNNDIRKLEQLWSIYKYEVLSKSHKDYLTIRELLKNKTHPPTHKIIEIIQKSLQLPESKKDAVNGANHIWGYFKKEVSKEEKQKYKKLIEEYQKNRIPYRDIQAFLWQLLEQYPNSYLMNSSYFNSVRETKS